MRACDVDYLAPARFDDLIESFVRVRRIGTTSMTYEFEAFRLPDEARLATATQVLVLVDLGSRRPTPVPDDLRTRIAAFEGDDLEL
jgi:acyl-CoA thioester hydrolase